MRRELLLAALLTPWLPRGPARAATRNAAITMDRVGGAELVVDDKPVRLNLLDYLPVGAQLRLPAGARVSLVYLSTSTEWVFAGPGRYQMLAEAPSTLSGAPPAKGVNTVSPLQDWHRVDPARRERMSLGAAVTRSGLAIRIVGPDECDVLGNPPTLVWQSTRAQRVRVTVHAAATMAMVAQAELDGDRWAAQAPLPPGDYAWRVAPVTGDVLRGAVARFRVVDGEAARYRYLRSAPTDFAPRLARALMLDAEGFTHDAQLILASLAAERPDEPELETWRR